MGDLARNCETDGLNHALGVQLVTASDLAFSNVATTLGHPSNTALRVGGLELADVVRPWSLIDKLVVANVSITLRQCQM